MFMYIHSDPLYQLAGKKYLNKTIFLTYMCCYQCMVYHFQNCQYFFEYNHCQPAIRLFIY